MSDDLATIEQAAERYRRSLDNLLDASAWVDRKLRRIKTQHAPELRQAANQAAQKGTELERLIAENPQLFEKPRKRTLHGITLGYQQNKASLSVPDEARTIAAIKEIVPDRRSELIKTEEKIQKGPLARLGRALLERLGATVVQAQDSVVVKPAESDGIKMASDLLAAAESAAEQDAETDGQSEEAA